MRFTFRRAHGPRDVPWAARAVAAAILVGGATAATAGTAAAQVHPTGPATATTAPRPLHRPARAATPP